MELRPDVPCLTPDSPLEALSLSGRALNCLHRCGVNTLGQMVVFVQTHDLYAVQNMGVKTVEEVRAKAAMLTNADGSFCMDVALPQDASFQAGKRYVLTEWPVSDAGFSKRTLTVLERAKVEWVHQLLGMEGEELGSLDGAGVTVVKDILQNVQAMLNAWQQDGVLSPKDRDLVVQSQAFAQCLRASESAVLRDFIQTARMYPQAQQEAFCTCLYQLPTMRDVTKRRIIDLLPEHDEGLPLAGLEQAMPRTLLNTAIVQALLAELEMERKVRIEGERVVKVFPRFIDFCRNWQGDETDRDMVLSRLFGETLEEIGHAYGITRERVRQRVARVIADCNKKQVRFDEERYRTVFAQYDINMDDFRLAFGTTDDVYNYLDMTTHGRGWQPLADALDDTSIPQKIRKQLEKVVYRDYVLLDGVRVKKDRQQLVQHYMQRHCQEITPFDEMYSGYNAWAKEHGLAEYAINSDKSYENVLNDRSRFVLWNIWRRLRFYDIDGQDYQELLDALNLSQYENMEISTLKLFRDNADMMRRYDIRDEYELHNLLKKIWPKDDESVRFRKMPTLYVGTPDRASQVLELLVQYAPITLEELGTRYEEAYGIKRLTAMGSYFMDFQEYCHDGVFTIDMPPLVAEQADVMRRELSDDFYMLSDVKRRYLALFPGENPGNLNPHALKLLGFNVFANYLIRNTWPSASIYFRTQLTQWDVTDANDLPHDFIYISQYSEQLNDLRQTREIVEYEVKKYIHIRRLADLGVMRADLEAYCNAVAAQVPEGTIFTVESLRNEGFCHPLDDLGFEPYFYSSVVLEDRERFAYQRMGGTRILRRGTATPNLYADLIHTIMEQNRRMDLADLMDLLRRHYGIDAAKDKTIHIIRNAGMWYDSIMEAVYLDYSTYLKEIDE